MGIVESCTRDWGYFAVLGFCGLGIRGVPERVQAPAKIISNQTTGRGLAVDR